MKIKKRLMAIFGKSRKIDSVRMAVRETIETTGWKIIEDHIRKSIQRNYTNLLTISPDKLEAIQCQIETATDMMMSIYKMAQYQWRFKQRDDIQEAFLLPEDSKSFYEEAIDEHNKEIENARNN